MKGMLESAGVECMLVGENANNLMQAAFRVRLQVKVEDEVAAQGVDWPSPPPTMLLDRTSDLQRIPDQGGHWELNWYCCCM